MPVSVFDLFSIGIGPSSSHTVGPMRAAKRFVAALEEAVAQAEPEKAPTSLESVTGIDVHAYGSLAATGAGHGTFGAILLGLSGFAPETIDPEIGWARLAEIEQKRQINLGDTGHMVAYCEADIVQHPLTILPRHPNGLCITAFAGERTLHTETYYSVGGGFVVTEAEFDGAPVVDADRPLPYPYSSAKELIDICLSEGMRISDVALANESALRSREEVFSGLLEIWSVMSDCIEAGCRTHGYLPGNLKVRRRASSWFEQLEAEREESKPVIALDYAILAAMAVNEENAAGGRVVTAPTNGAAGIVPAVLYYALKTLPELDDEGIVRYLLTAAAIGSIYKERASISGAEVGCQGEVGSASSMAAGAMAELLGGTPDQCENAAEIAMEHNLGLTCDPVGGLVQVPCIERNGIAATKAITAARMALRGDGTHLVSLDQVIETMRQTGLDMSSKYKETAMGGLAVNVVEC